MRADIRLTVEQSKFLADALGPETSRDIPRTKVEILTDGPDILIRLTADDVTALRAVMNSYLRWLKLAIDTKETVGGI